MTARAQTPNTDCKPDYERSYHIDWNEELDRWDITDDHGRVYGHCHNLDEATDLALREAHRDHGDGKDVIVCVEREDGSYGLVWASRLAIVGLGAARGKVRDYFNPATGVMRYAH